jgi:CRISPR system Cascade subunit CasE
MSAHLHMVQLWLDARRLMELGRALRLPLSQADTPYLVHCALGELFQDMAPKPFALDGEPDRFVRVLGYAAAALPVLHEWAKGHAQPLPYAICDWHRSRSKPMPTRFPEHTRLGFELRACPVKRMLSEGKHHRKGAEVDAYLARVWSVNDEDVPLERRDVYIDWLRELFSRDTGAQIIEVEMTHFELLRMMRRTQQERSARVIKKPAVTFRGILQVTHDEAFRQALAAGLGRHKSFGFGMLKLRRAEG